MCSYSAALSFHHCGARTEKSLTDPHDLCLYVLVPEDNSHGCLDMYFSHLPVRRVLSGAEGKNSPISSIGLLYHTLLPKQTVVISFPSAEHPLGSSVHDVLEGQT